MGASVSKGTTPTIILQLNQENLDLTQANNVYVTFKSNLKTVTKCGDSLTVEPNQVSVYLSQKDTLGFNLEDVAVQVNWTYDEGRRACSTIAFIKIYPNLLAREVE